MGASAGMGLLWGRLDCRGYGQLGSLRGDKQGRLQSALQRARRESQSRTNPSLEPRSTTARQGYHQRPYLLNPELIPVLFSRRLFLRFAPCLIDPEYAFRGQTLSTKRDSFGSTWMYLAGLGRKRLKTSPSVAIFVCGKNGDE